MLGARLAVSALLTAQTGRPFTPRVSTDNSNTGNLGGQFGYDRPNEVPAGTAGAVEYEGRAFVIAPPYTFGDAGRNILSARRSSASTRPSSAPLASAAAAT